MRSILGKLFLAPVMMAAAALATGTAMAESSLNVPFSFTAAGKVWPAGSYTVHKDLSGNMVTLISKVNSLSFTSLIGPGDPDPNEQNVTLKFDEMGAGHALRSIQYGPQITSRLDRKALRSEYITSSGR
jgi:hypothetical protein